MRRSQADEALRSLAWLRSPLRAMRRAYEPRPHGQAAWTELVARRGVSGVQTRRLVAMVETRRRRRGRCRPKKAWHPVQYVGGTAHDHHSFSL